MRFMATLLLILVTVPAPAQYYLNMFQKNGQKLQFPIANLDSVVVTDQSIDKGIVLTDNITILANDYYNSVRNEKCKPRVVTDPLDANNKCVVVTTNADCTNSYDSQFFIRLNEPLAGNQRVIVSMRVRADVRQYAQNEIHSEPGNFIKVNALTPFYITDEWQSISLDYIYNGSDWGAQTFAFDLSYISAANNCYFDDISVIVQPYNSAEASLLTILGDKSRQLLTGDIYTLKASVYNSVGYNVTSPTIEWKSSDASVVAVDANGMVTAKSEGTAVIYAYSGNLKDSCTISVSNSVIQYVDLGLSVNWATCNVGANKPEDYGNYYAWGETSTKSTYPWASYRFRARGDSYDYVKFSKYNTKSDRGTVDNKTTLDPEDDVAHVTWGGKWRLPTKEEREELRDNCTWTWITWNGVNGYLVTSKRTGYENRSIFLPAAGYFNGTTLSGVGTRGNYLTSSLDTENPTGEWNLDFNSEESFTYYYGYRYGGHTVRPVSSSFIALKLDAESVLLGSGGEITLTAVVEKDGQAVDFKVQWSSDNPDVASVSDDGVVKGLSRGTALITAEYYGHKATCLVTVTKPDGASYKYVDLGLSVKWATFNVGATAPVEYGDYFAWGETEPKTDYSWSTYKYCNGSYNTLTKYCNNSRYGNNGFTDTKTTLDPDDDVAHVKWGGDWRMPTKDEFTELLNNCTWTWTTLNDVKGYRVTSKKSGYTDRSIFLPAAGYRDDAGLDGVGSYGYYWSSSLDTDGPDSAWGVYFYSDFHSTYYNFRYYGQSVRPVCP